MNSFDDRERGYEAKFAHDQEIEFRILARRNHLLGVWAGDLLGLKGGELALYAGTVMSADLAEPGDDDVLQKVARDLHSRSLSVSDHEIRAKMDQLLGVARREILTGE
jgi:hypothetical protein